MLYGQDCCILIINKFFCHLSLYKFLSVLRLTLNKEKTILGAKYRLHDRSNRIDLRPQVRTVFK